MKKNLFITVALIAVMALSVLSFTACDTASGTTSTGDQPAGDKVTVSFWDGTEELKVEEIEKGATVAEWTPEKSGYDGYSMFGYDSGVTYVIAYCAEDLDGRVGPVKFAEVATTEAVPGPNPKVEIESIRYDEENKIVTGKFKTNQDSKVIKYFGVGAGDALYASCALNDLVNNPGRRTYEDFMNLWESQLVQLGLSSNAESVTFGVNRDKVSDTPVLVAAVAIGEKKDANGAAEDVYSEVACKIYYTP